MKFRTVLVPNKIDLAPEVPALQLQSKEICEVCPISALTGTGVDELLACVGKLLDRHKERFYACFSQAQGALIAMLRDRGRIIDETYDAEGVHVIAIVTPKLAGQMRKLLHASSAPKVQLAEVAMLNLPNTLTLIRILTIPFFLEFLAYHHYWEALIIFAIGGLTDFLDGLAARWMNQQTALGAYLDPVADKLLVITSFIMLGLIGGIPPWLAVVVVARDILILVGYVIIYVLVEERFEVKPSRIGKWSTTFQLLTLAVALALLA